MHLTSHAPMISNSSSKLRTRVAWQRLTQLGPFRWSGIAPWRATRVAIGVVGPLALGGAVGHMEYGAFAALGALPAGFASFQGESRTRVAAVAVASIGMALSTFVGATAAAISPWLLVPIIALWGYFTGLTVCLGPWVNVAVLQWSVALLIAIGLPFDAEEATVRACLVFAGGLFQGVLVVATWAVRRGSRERTALAASYAALATYASDLAAGALDAPSPAAFPAGTALQDANPLLPSATRLALVDLLEQAERIRASLAALATEAVPVAARDQDDLRALMGDAATALTMIADALTAPRAGRLSCLRGLRRMLTQRTIAPTAPWRWAAETLLGQLRAVGRIIANLDAVRPKELGDPTEPPPPPGHGDGFLAPMITTLRANLTTTSEAGRHALRLAVAVALAEAIVQAAGLYQGRWATLTVFLVLKPDYASTVYRGVQRGLGTAIGAGLGAVAELVHPGEGGQLVAAGLCVMAAYALFDVNYLLFSVFLTAFIVVLLQLLGSPAVLTAEARFFETFIGAALGLAVYLAWPSWEGTTAQDKFVRLLEAHRTYMTGLLQALAHPDKAEAPRLRVLQAAARRARSDAEAATTRLSDEPAHAAITPATAQAIIAAVARLAHAELALHALALPPRRAKEDAGPRDAAIAERIDALASALDLAMTDLASALRGLVPPEPIPALRPIHARLRDETVSESALVGVTDRLVDAVDTIGSILRERFAVASDAPP